MKTIMYALAVLFLAGTVGLANPDPEDKTPQHPPSPPGSGCVAPVCIDP